MTVLNAVTSLMVAASFGICMLIFVIIAARIRRRKVVWWVLAGAAALPMLFMLADGVMLLTGSPGLVDLLF